MDTKKTITNKIETIIENETIDENGVIIKEVVTDQKITITEEVVSKHEPNAIIWGPNTYCATESEMCGIFEKMLELGLDTVPLANNYGINSASKTLANAKEKSPYLKATLGALEKMGNPKTQFEYSFGYFSDGDWRDYSELDGDFNEDGKVNGADYLVWQDNYGESMDGGDYLNWQADYGEEATYKNGGLQIYRKYKGTFDESHLEVYHTPFGVLPDHKSHIAKCLKWSESELSEKTGHDLGKEVRVMHCPNYRGLKYHRQLARYEEFIKWLKPDVVTIDTEFYYGPITTEKHLKRFKIGDGTEENGGISQCSRCKTWEGLLDGQRGIGRDLVAIANRYNDAFVTAYAVYGGQEYGTENYFPYENVGWAAGAPSLYQMGYDAKTGLALPEKECINKLKEMLQDRRLPYTTPEALKGSYPWLSQYRGPSALPTAVAASMSNYHKWYDSNGYYTPDEFYDICYILAKNGAKSFSLWPAFRGVEWIEGYNPPNEYTKKSDDIVLLLIEAGLRAFKDYNA